MTTTKNKTSLADAVLALDREHHCTQFHIELKPKDAVEWAEKFQPYNGIRTGDLPRLVERINKRVPPMDFGGTNANNGHSHHTFEVGNEGSLVIYLVVRGFYLPKTDSLKKLAAEVEGFARDAHADEISSDRASVVERDAIRVRMWWD